MIAHRIGKADPVFFDEFSQLALHGGNNGQASAKISIGLVGEGIYFFAAGNDADVEIRRRNWIFGFGTHPGKKT